MLNGPNRFMGQSKLRPFHHWLYISIKPREKKYDSPKNMPWPEQRMHIWFSRCV